MRILALDTALGATSVAVYDTEGARIVSEERSEMVRGHAEALVPMAGRVLDKAGLSFHSIDRFAATIGPGSFTGIRIGIAAARAFGLAHRKPVVGVSTLAAYAAPVLFGGEKRPVAAAVDARHGMIFYQLTGADGRQIAGPGLFSLADAARKVGSGAVIVTGDAAELLARAMKEQNPDFRITPDTARPSPAPPILWVARLASVADPAASPCRPLYLREANVTPQDGARLQRASAPEA
ncbi:MAG: tRNA (adenosine(37)-N6)-threonylcarbamoyltransferase complex dimerization subunit type 1 TsaB [Rhabdaerophilum sp.]